MFFLYQRINPSLYSWLTGGVSADSFLLHIGPSGLKQLPRINCGNHRRELLSFRECAIPTHPCAFRAFLLVYSSSSTAYCVPGLCLCPAPGTPRFSRQCSYSPCIEQKGHLCHLLNKKVSVGSEIGTGQKVLWEYRMVTCSLSLVRTSGRIFMQSSECVLT